MPRCWAWLGLRGVTINDLVLLAVARTLPQFPGLNALFTGDAIHQHKHVQLGVAVDTPRSNLYKKLDRYGLKKREDAT